jgi:hypothetical protein
MNILYKTTENTINIEKETYNSYGIECYKDNKLYDTISNICLNKNSIINLCDYLNNNNISPVHFYDIVEDFLTK